MCLSIGYLVNQNVEIGKYVGILINDNSKSRLSFLNNTFCGKFINGKWQKTINESEIIQRNLLLQAQINGSEIDYKNLSCIDFINKNGFYSKHITDLEYENPIAFSILVYKNFYQFQVLMRTLYTRSNFHCIHVDQDAPAIFYSYAMQLSKCLDNVYIAHPRIKVEWGTMALLEAERVCQIYHLKQSSRWHYHMTIAVSFLISYKFSLNFESIFFRVLNFQYKPI